MSILFGYIALAVILGALLYLLRECGRLERRVRELEERDRESLVRAHAQVNPPSVDATNAGASDSM